MQRHPNVTTPTPGIDKVAPDKRGSARRGSVIALFAACTALFACGEDASSTGASASPGTTAPPENQPAAIGKSTSHRRTLALADPGGQAAVDVIVRAEQARATRTGDTSNDPWILLGRAWVRKARESADPGFYLQARACAEIVQESDATNLLAEGLIAQVEYNQHRFLESFDAASKILARDPKDITALTVRADALLELGRHDEAIAAVDALAKAKPSLPSYLRVAHMQWLRGKKDEALAAAKLAIEASNDPTDQEPRCYALSEAASYFWHEGDLDGALAGYEKALGACADYPYALVGKGRVLLARGDGKRAAEALAIAHEKSPLVETAWLLGDARAMAGDAPGAEAAYALVIKEGRATDGRTLARFYATKNRDADEAVKLAREEMSVRPGVYTLDTLAWALYRQKDFAEAKKLSDRALALGTRDAALLYHAGAIRIALGDKADGEARVKRALALNPTFDVTGADEARSLVR